MTEVNFKTDRAKQAYDEMVEIAETGKREVVRYIQDAICKKTDMLIVLNGALGNSKTHSGNMALALETACRIDREEYGMEIAIHNTYDGEKMEN